MKRKFVWLIPGLLIVSLLAMLAAMASAAPNGATGAISLDGGADMNGDGDPDGTFFSNNTGFNEVKITVQDDDLSTIRTGVARFADPGAGATVFGLTSARAILEGEIEETEEFEADGATVAFVLDFEARDADGDGIEEDDDIQVTVNGAALAGDAYTADFADPTTVTLDIAPLVGDDIQITYMYSEFEGAATPLRAVAEQSATFGATFEATQTSVAVTGATAETSTITIANSPPIGITDDVTLTFKYEVVDTVQKIVTVSSPSLSTRGLTRELDGVENAAGSGEFDLSVILYSAGDYDYISAAAGNAANDSFGDADTIVEIYELDATGQLGAALLAQVAADASVLGLAADAPAADFLSLILPVTDGEVVTTTYDDGGVSRTASANVDLKAPIITVNSPTGDYTNNPFISIILNVTDQNSTAGTAAGLSTADLGPIIVPADADPDGPADIVPELVGTNSFNISRSVNFDPSDQGEVTFWIATRDRVGNIPDFAGDDAALAAGNPAAPLAVPGNPGSIILDTTAPEPLATGAVSTGGTIDDRLSTELTGTHTGAEDSADLTDAAAGFGDVDVGDTITNVTDGTEAVVDAVAGTTIMTTPDLDWDTGDNYTISNPDLGEVEGDVEATNMVRFQVTLGDAGVESAPIDPDTVETGDFIVTGSTIASVTVDASGDGILIELTSDLATDARPDLELVGDVRDLAGNSMETFDGDNALTALDGLAPTIFDVMLSGDAGSGNRVLSKGTVNISFTSSEAAAITPTIAATYLIDDNDDEVLELGMAEPVGEVLAVNSAGANNWSSSVGINQIADGALREGIVNLIIIVTDAAGNLGMAGTVEPHDGDDFETDALLIEFDAQLNDGDAPDVVVSPDTGATDDAAHSTDVPNAYVTINFDSEASEYAVDGTPGDGAFVFPDSFDGVTLTSATWEDPDGNITDILANMVAVDDNSFLYAAQGMAEGVHTLRIQAMDEAGNVSTSLGSSTVSTFVITVEVTERSPYEVEVLPGFSLISMPAQPNTTDINEVLGDIDEVTFVMTYDNATGLWLFASRDPGTGSFSGNLTDLDAAHGYWIQSSSVTTIEFDIPRAAGGNPVFPVVVELFEGWNVVPVGGDPDANPAGTPIDADTYFGGLNWAAAYTFNTAGVANVRIGPDAAPCNNPNTPTDESGLGAAGQDCLVFGQAYFVYMNEDAVLIP